MTAADGTSARKFVAGKTCTGIPYSMAEEHDRILLDNIRNRLSPDDTLYLLEDVFARHYHPDRLLEFHRAAPHIVPIRGNHESHWLHKTDAGLLRRIFSDI